jgi:small conductance mechanosensitive channel
VLLFSEGWTPWTSQVLYLNAFLAFGLARVALRAVAHPRAEAEPALLSVDPRAQRAIYRSLRPVAGCLAQGFLFAVPLLELWAGFAAARPGRLLVATAAALLAFWAIRRIRRALGAARPGPLAPAQAPPPPPQIMASADPLPGTIGPPPPLPLPGAVVPGDPVGAPSTAPAAMAAGLGTAWASLWPLLAVLYVLYAWVTAVTRPALATGIVLGGTAATGLAVLMVVAALQLLRRAGRLSWPLPGLAHAALPTLKPRADRITASVGAALAVALLLAAPLAAALGWGWVEAGTLLERPLPRRLAGQAASAGLVVLGAAALWALVASWIDARLARSEAMAGQGQDSGRARTLLALFRNAFTVAVAVIAGMVALSQLGLDIAPLLAGAGVVGLAVGFGAQSLVKDIITGVFIQLEGAIDVGDVVAVAGITGGVERLTIRSVRLRTMDGATHVIPFSAVTTVTNLTRDYGYHVADLLVGYGQGVPAVRAGMEDAFARLLRDPLAADVDGALDMQGVAELRPMPCWCGRASAPRPVGSGTWGGATRSSSRRCSTSAASRCRRPRGRSWWRKARTPWRACPPRAHPSRPEGGNPPISGRWPQVGPCAPGARDDGRAPGPREGRTSRWQLCPTRRIARPEAPPRPAPGVASWRGRGLASGSSGTSWTGSTCR